MNTQKQPTICFFGTYDRSFTSNKLMLEALHKINAKVIEVNAEIKVTRLDTKKEMNWGNFIMRILRKYRIFTEIAKHWKELKTCDVIYVGYPGHFDVFIAWPLAKILGIKLVFNPQLIFYTGFAEEQGILNKESFMGRAAKWGESLIYNICDMVFADTPLQETFLIEQLNVKKEKIRVLPIGADDSYYRYTPYTNKDKKLNVVYYGLYSPIHGVDYIIEAARILKADKDIVFTFVGNGNAFQRNYDKAQKYGLTNCVFYPNTPLDQHPAIIEKGDIFLGFLEKHPSVDRIIPNKIYQGLALNKVVLTADAAVTRSLFKHKENMYLVKPADPQALANAVLELKNDPTLRKHIAESGNDLFKKEFKPEQVANKLVSFMKELL
ncbi:MAG: glycosyltransferase family 4 protein [Weeksellaceae bacterium]